MRDEAIVCQCLWPKRVWETLTGHQPTCPVETVAKKQGRVAFTLVVEGGLDEVKQCYPS
jgi:hypothetical protein